MSEEYEPAEYTVDATLKPLFDTWDTSSYWQRRMVRKKVKEGPPRFLYKYLGFDGRFDKQNLFDWIVRSTFRLSRPSEFNDPFDFHGVMVVDGTEEEFRARCIDIARKNMPEGSQEEEIQKGAKELSRKPRDEVRRQGQESFERMRKSFGVACFSTDPKTVLLWSHYAAGHSGVCLQLEVARDFRAFAPALEVRITTDSKLPTMNWITTLPKDISKVMLSKNSWWAYERERRIIQADQGGKYVPVLADALVGIVLGCRIKPENEQLINEFLAKRAARTMPAVTVYRAAPHRTLARLVVRKRVVV
jgi:hypothetical protein